MMQPILIPVSPGELLDKLTILRIKAVKISDAARLANVNRELEILERARVESIPETAQLLKLTEELSQTNHELWDVEDSLRECEAEQNFSAHFVHLARSVYRLNTIRTQLKRQVNELLHSSIQEEKQYRGENNAPAAQKFPAS